MLHFRVQLANSLVELREGGPYLMLKFLFDSSDFALRLLTLNRLFQELYKVRSQLRLNLRGFLRNLQGQVRNLVQRNSLVLDLVLQL